MHEIHRSSLKYRLRPFRTLRRPRGIRRTAEPKGPQRSMSVPEAPDPAFDTLMLDPVEPVDPVDRVDVVDSVSPVVSHPDSLSLITAAPLDLRKRFTELDGLRGAAALFVVVFHL